MKAALFYPMLVLFVALSTLLLLSAAIRYGFRTFKKAISFMRTMETQARINLLPVPQPLYQSVD